jgi:hypothetical protein
MQDKQHEVESLIAAAQTVDEQPHLVSLLAWKALCLAQFSQSKDSQELRQFCVEWHERVPSGWNEYKTEMRNSNGLDILVSHMSGPFNPFSIQMRTYCLLITKEYCIARSL